MEIKDKIAVVTGSSRGIGKAILLSLAKKGAKVVINYRENELEALKVVKEIEDLGVEYKLIKADVGTQEGVDQLFDEAFKAFGHVDILINNASSQGGNDFKDESNDIWEKHFKNDFLSALMCSRKFVKNSKQQGKIINISSVYGIGEKSSMSFMAYSAAKAAINNFTVNLAKKASPTIQVNAIAPGYTITDIWNGTSDEDFEACAKETLIKRMIKPDEIAHTAIFLCENDAITGQILVVDGGLGIKEC
jgi:3-oxoacyl-[acyl-carrier protein] reductase